MGLCDQQHSSDLTRIQRYFAFSPDAVLQHACKTFPRHMADGTGQEHHFNEQLWHTETLTKLDYYDTEYRRLKETTSILELAMWKIKLDGVSTEQVIDEWRQRENEDGSIRVQTADALIMMLLKMCGLSFCLKILCVL